MIATKSSALSVSWVGAFAQCFGWLQQGLSDFQRNPSFGLSYGLGFFVVSYAVLAFLWTSGLAWMLLPALAGASLASPILAIGLYQKSREIKYGQQCRVESPGQFAVVGAILMVLLLTWFRTATVLYALFFGLLPFPGFLETIQTVLLTEDGRLLLLVGTLVGGLFAALTLAISFFSVPMLIDRKIDAFSAMGHSFSACVRNFKIAVTWGVIVVATLVLGFATGLLSMIVLFPLLGYATWHAYDELFGTEKNKL